MLRRADLLAAIESARARDEGASLVEILLAIEGERLARIVDELERFR
jgi:hypothetical protein